MNKIKKNDEQRDLEYQIDNYEYLNIKESYRGQVILVFSGLYIFSFLLSFFGLVALTDLLWSLVIYIPILFFIYKGHRWAIITMMVLWTIEKLYTIETFSELGYNESYFNVPFLLIWLGIIKMLVSTLWVENGRRKRQRELETSNKKGLNFCSQCGSQIIKNANFCTNCGFNTAQ